MFACLELASRVIFTESRDSKNKKTKEPIVIKEGIFPDLEQLINNIREIEPLIALYQLTPSDKFPAIMKEFLKEAKAALEQIDLEKKKMLQVLDEMIVLYQLDLKVKEGPSAFFKVIMDFLHEYEKSHKANLDQGAKDEEEAKKLRQKEMKDQKRRERERKRAEASETNLTVEHQLASSVTFLDRQMMRKSFRIDH